MDTNDLIIDKVTEYKLTNIKTGETTTVQCFDGTPQPTLKDMLLHPDLDAIQARDKILNEPSTYSGLPRLSGDYNRGYTKAIQDMIEIFKYIQPDLKHHHKNMNGKLAVELLNCCLMNRENIRENVIGDAFMRYNSNGYFEWYIPERKD